jgi:iron complex transport system permease protein
MALGLSLTTSGFAVVSNAFVFALIPTAVILLVSKFRTASPATMIMTGIAVMYMFNAMATLIRLYADPDTQAAIFAWTVGTTDIREWSHIATMAVFVSVGTAACILMSGRLNVMAAGDEGARSMGVNAPRLRVVALLVVSLLAAGIVSFTGLIGFVGLVAPHITRLFIGSDNKFLIPACAVFGSMLLIVADALGRTILSPNVIQVGVVMSFVGGPIFLLLLLGSRKRMWSS